MNKHECENLGPRGNQIRQRRGAGEGHLHAHSLRWSWGAVSLRSEPKAPEALLRGVVIISPTVVKPTFTISKRLNLQQTGTFCLEIVRPAWLWHGCLCYSISLFADGSKLWIYTCLGAFTLISTLFSDMSAWPQHWMCRSSFCEFLPLFPSIPRSASLALLFGTSQPLLLRYL